MKADPRRRLFIECDATKPAPDAGDLALLRAAIAGGDEASVTFTSRHDADAFARSFAGTITESEPHE